MEEWGGMEEEEWKREEERGPGRLNR